MKIILFTASILLLSLSTSCMKGESVDTIIHNAQVHTMDLDNTIYDAVAMKDGKIVEVGPERQILNKYSADEYIDAGQKTVYPGFIDAHGHLLGYARAKLSVDLFGCTSYEQMLVRIQKYQAIHKRSFIVGCGWDQSLWGEDELPTNERLNELFPNISVALMRIDGHSLLANEYLLKKSNAIELVAGDPETYIGGNFLYTEDGEPTGMVIDNAMNPILDLMPAFPKKELTDAVKEIQTELYSYGITGIHDAGVTKPDLDIIEKWVNSGILKINIYQMLLPTEENIAFARKNGIYENKNLYVRSFKVYGDGALGSRGAFLKQPYDDLEGSHGHLNTSVANMNRIAAISEEVGYQMNTHAIGDSTNRLILDLYERIYKTNPDHRWRIEHAQIVDPSDFPKFAKVGAFPSVQPTHATTDQRWAESRIGKARMKGAYAYRSLLKEFGMIAIGTDFPVEYVDPFRTIHAATARKNSENSPSGGFLANESITLDQCIRGMTIWAAMASFQEDKLGTIEAGKDATIVIFDKPIASYATYKPNFSNTVFIKGKKVYSVE